VRDLSIRKRTLGRLDGIMVRLHGGLRTTIAPSRGPILVTEYIPIVRQRYYSKTHRIRTVNGGSEIISHSRAHGSKSGSSFYCHVLTRPLEGDYFQDRQGEFGGLGNVDGVFGRRRVRITVADCGHGMLLAATNWIFDPFFTTKGSVGTGLGLWVCKQH
jgi:hypothetical protein